MLNPKIILTCFMLLLSPPIITAQGQESCLLVAQLENPGALSSREEISKLINFSKKSGIGIIFIQVYRGNQAWFNSKSADISPFQACYKTIGADALNFLINQAHDQGIKVYAWLNLLSLSKNKDAPLLKKYGWDILTRNTKEKASLEDYKIDNQYFLEPSDLRIRHELSNIVEELIVGYPKLDGILFDYIRYPDLHPDYGYAKRNIELFKAATGLNKIDRENPAWQEWKRAQVTDLLLTLTEKARTLHPDLQIGATGCAPYVRAYCEAFQDWPSWVNKGYIDFAVLMSYCENIIEFQKDIAELNNRLEDLNRVYVAIGAYKLMHLPEVFRKQLQLARGAKAGGYVFFHYGSFIDSPILSQCLEGQK